jgi:hydroxypyruvate reductase
MTEPLGHAHALQIVQAVRAACDPRGAVARSLQTQSPRSHRPALIAVGKAAASMYRGFLDLFPEPQSRFMVVPEGTDAPPWAIRADHPLPTTRCLAAARALIEFVHQMKTNGACDGFIVLLSGGASSLLTLPFETIPLERYAPAIEHLLRSGLSIHELNTFRKHCEQLKGGRLGVLMHPLPCDAYLLSDVVGDNPSTIGSGPTVPDPTTLETFQTLLQQVRTSLFAEHLLTATAHLPETPKPGDPRLANSRHAIVGSNAMAIQAAAECARQLGYHPVTVETGVVGEAEAAGRRLGARASAAAPGEAIVLGGETVVSVRSPAGRGGRNQHLALAAAIEAEGHPNVTLATFATDGVDGPTDAAGAIVTGETCVIARAQGLDPARFLRESDSHTFFTLLDGHSHSHLIRTGPTGTNVNDIALALVRPASL